MTLRPLEGGAVGTPEKEVSIDASEAKTLVEAALAEVPAVEAESARAKQVQSALEGATATSVDFDSADAQAGKAAWEAAMAA